MKRKTFLTVQIKVNVASCLFGIAAILMVLI